MTDTTMKDADSPVADWTHVYSGKVRDIYVPAGQSRESAGVLLVVASDRVSAFDYVLEPAIPDKGALLTSLSRWWFDQLDVTNHLADNGSLLAGSAPAVPSSVAERSMLVIPLSMYPIECVVRGYLAGSGWQEYQQTQSVCGVPLPAGLHNGDRLPEPIYTPAYKAPMGEHDENISFERSAEIVGDDAAASLRDLSLQIYSSAAATAEAKGLIIADTKFEFGAHPLTDQITLGDEVLTSDSSRYWDAATYATETTPVARMRSFDKQPVRDWLAAHWDRTGEPPRLPDDVVAATTERYRTLVERLTT